jgi:hypothetical protein
MPLHSSGKERVKTIQNDRVGKRILTDWRRKERCGMDGYAISGRMPKFPLPELGNRY